MALPPYKLRCELVGHSKDVRTVAVTYDGSIVSGSRDHTAKLWTPDGSGLFVNRMTFEGHQSFVSSICTLPPSSQHPRGLVFTGGQDGIISAFDPENSQSLFKLTGHGNSVCALSPGQDGCSILSASWDTTARLWSVDERKVLGSFSGHAAAVWCAVQLPHSGYVVTASADKTIKIWDGVKCQATLTGHEDCVRGLSVISDVEFLSCSNDSSVRRWHVSGGCVSTYYGHSNFIYSICVISGTRDAFVTSSEDRSVKLWQGQEAVQTIDHPAQSVWAVTCMQNGDVVTASSDGVIRVFSSCPERQASEDILQVFEQSTILSASAAQKELGGVKISDLPGPESLLEAGRRDGQTKMVREGDKVTCHSWDAAAGEWKKIGDVVGAAGGTEATSGKTLYEGKEYDYVFSVDIEEGKPPLKLPYNTSEDPWFAAQRFIDRNNLNQLFLDQVANFITDNTKGIILGQESVSSEYCDPFTGGGRYIPNQATGTSGGGIDPFTGGNRYVPQSGSNTTVTSKPEVKTTEKFFPQTTYLRFDQANTSAIFEKLRAFNQTTGDSVHQVTEEELEGIMKLTDINCTPTQSDIRRLQQLLGWPQDFVFPVLDVLRLALRGQRLNKELCSGAAGEELLSFLRQNMRPGSPLANQMLSVRSLCNMFAASDGETLALRNRVGIMSSLRNILPLSSKGLQIAAATLLLNFAVSHKIETDYVGASTDCFKFAVALLDQLDDSEAQFRVLVALGTLISNDRNLMALTNETSLGDQLSKLINLDSSKTSSCASQVLDLIK